VGINEVPVIPAAGWLPFGNNTNQSADAAPLPVVHELSYGDGAQGIYEPGEEELQFENRIWVAGAVGVESLAGFVGNDYGFLVTVTQDGAYGAILIDMLDPPDLTKDLEEIAETIGTVEPCPSNDELLTIEACCSLFEGWIFDGEVFFDGTRTFGGIL
jgi:hypothetical protein